VAPVYLHVLNRVLSHHGIGATKPRPMRRLSPGETTKGAIHRECRASPRPAARPRGIQGHVPARVWGFESPLRHQ
jgi:hypothetical protein